MFADPLFCIPWGCSGHFVQSTDGSLYYDNSISEMPAAEGEDHDFENRVGMPGIDPGAAWKAVIFITLLWTYDGGLH